MKCDKCGQSIADGWSSVMLIAWTMLFFALGALIMPHLEVIMADIGLPLELPVMLIGIVGMGSAVILLMLAVINTLDDWQKESEEWEIE